MLFWIANGMFCWMSYLVVFYYFGRNKFDMNYWAYSFSLCVLATCWVSYRTVVDGRFTHVMSYGTVAFAAIINVHLLTCTIVELMRRHLFLPDQTRNAGPFQVFKMTHHALRAGVDKLREMVGFSSFDPADPAFDSALQRFGALFDQLALTLETHAAHEETVLFPSIMDFYPGATPLSDASHQHEEELNRVREMRSALATLRTAGSPADARAAAVQTLKRLIPEFATHLHAHIDHEEDNLRPLQIKPHNLVLQRQIIKRCYNMTPGSTWRVYIPFVINTVPQHPYRLAFLKALTAIFPERAELFGQMLFNAVSEDLWDRLLDDVPELRQRGQWFYERYW
jgi:hypothetical protein